MFCPNAVDWNVIGVWFAGIATLLAAIGTVSALFFTIRSTNKARRETLALRREVEEGKRRDQATRVCAWIHGQWTTLRLRNGSHEPVYNAVLHFVWVRGGWATGEDAPEDQRDRLRAVVQVLPPGDFTVVIAGPRGGSMPVSMRTGIPGVELAFTDAANHHWMRRATGDLNEQPAGPIEHYGLDRPSEYPFGYPHATLTPWPEQG